MNLTLPWKQLPYSPQDIQSQVSHVEALDRLFEKSKRNYLGGGQKEADRALYEGYGKALVVAQEVLARMLEKNKGKLG